MDRPKLEVADIFRRYGNGYRQEQGASLSTAQRRVMSAIERCRTSALGGHVEQCDQCGHQRVCFNSCRDRHCPKCQSLARAQWLEDRQAELLDCPYFHVVFTLPEEIAPSLTRTRKWSTAYSSEPQLRPCAPSLLIPNIWALRSAFSPFFTPGARICIIIPICIASLPVADSPPTASVGSPADLDSSCRCGCCPVCSAAYS
jgi:hypothetical protein